MPNDAIVVLFQSVFPGSIRMREVKSRLKFRCHVARAANSQTLPWAMPCSPCPRSGWAAPVRQRLRPFWRFCAGLPGRYSPGRVISRNSRLLTGLSRYSGRATYPWLYTYFFRWQIRHLSPCPTAKKPIILSLVPRRPCSVAHVR